jgi:hypothetical protein
MNYFGQSKVVASTSDAKCASEMGTREGLIGQSKNKKR